MGASSLESVINYSNEANFTFNSSLIEFSGGAARLKLQSALQAFTQDFTSDVGFTYDNTKAEFASGLVRQKDQTPTNSIMASLLTTKDLNWNKAGALTGTLNGAPTFSAAGMACTGAQGVYFVKTSAAQEVIRFKWIPNFTGGPSTNINLISGKSASNDNGRFALTYSPSGKLRITLYNQSGTLIYSAFTIGASGFTVVSGQTYRFSLTIDATNGTISLNRDGVLHGTLSPGVFTRGGTSLNYYVGAAPNVQRAEGTFKDVIWFNSNTYPAGDYTVPPFIYTEVPVTLPAFNHAFLGSILSYDSMTSTEAGSPRYLVKTGVGAAKYWNGSMWVASDGSYAQANSKAVMNANLPNLMDAMGALQVTLLVVFPAANTISSVDTLTFNTTANTAYPTSDPTITVNAGFLSDALESLAETMVTVAGADSLTYIFQVNGQDKYYDTGTSAWANSDGSLAQSNTAAELTDAVLVALDLASGVTVNLKVVLHSDDSLTTPEVATLTVGYNFFNTQNEPATCTVWGFYLDVSGQGVPGATVTFGLKRTLGQYREAAGSIIEKQVQRVTDENGRFEADLIRSSEFETAGTYVITIKDPTASPKLDTSYIEKTKAIEFTVPDLTNVDITDRISALA